MSKFTKEKFDGIIKSNLIKSDISADSFGYEIEGRKYENYYTSDCFKSFVERMKKEHHEKYYGGKGGELDEKMGRYGLMPPKMASVASSSRFCYLALKDINDVEFEKDCRIFDDNEIAPQLDSYIPQEYCNIFLEVKCHEIFDSHKLKMKNKYLTYFKENNIFPEIASNATEGEDEFTAPLSLFGIDKESSRFDVKQFICHLLGVAKKTGEKPAKLVYLFFIPVVDDVETAGEIKEVFDQLQSEIKAIFTSEPIVKFCKAKNISLSAIAEKSRIMETLTTENMVVLYQYSQGIAKSAMP